MNIDDRIEALEAENERLRERIVALEDALVGVDLPPIEFGLTPSEARAFGCILSRDLATRSQIFAATGLSVAEDDREIKIVDVFVCKMRRKLKPYGIEILTRWGEGYFVDAPTKAAVRQMMAQAGQVVA